MAINLGPIIPDKPGVEALRKFINQQVVNPVGNYPSQMDSAARRANLAAAQNRIFTDANSYIPKGFETYRVPTDFDLQRLPTQVGQSYRPSQPMSVAGAADLQELGRMLEGSSGVGSQATPRQNAIMKILAMENVPGVRNIAPYISQNLLNEAGLKEEGLFGPKTRYEVLDYRPAVGRTPATWNLGAYANMGLGAANILGFLPMLIEGGRVMSGRSTGMLPVDPRVGGMN